MKDNKNSKVLWISPTIYEFEVDRNIIIICESSPSEGGSSGAGQESLRPETYSTRDEETDVNPFSYNPFATE